MTISRTGKLNRRVTFLKQDGYITQGPNGQKVPNYVETTTCWFAYKQKFIKEVKAESTSYLNTVDIIIRQKQRVEILPDFIAEISGKRYNIININPDLTNDSFCVLVLKAVE